MSISVTSSLSLYTRSRSSVCGGGGGGDTLLAGNHAVVYARNPTISFKVFGVYEELLLMIQLELVEDNQSSLFDSNAICSKSV